MGREYNAPGSVSLLSVNESWVRWTLKGQEPWSILVLTLSNCTCYRDTKRRRRSDFRTADSPSRGYLVV
jgi:hypothetical protein